MSINQTTDVAIIGGGVIGCSIAYQLSKAGVQVSVIEREEIAAEASSAAAGLLAPAEVLTGPKAVADLFLASWSMTAEIIAEIEAASGMQVEYFQTGALHVLTNTDDQSSLRRYAEIWKAQGSDVKWLTGDQVYQYEPLLDHTFDAALYVPEAASIRPRLRTRASAEPARKYRAHYCEHTEVTGIEQHSAKSIRGQTAQWQTIGCAGIVIAT